jgi:hypothetical protein
VQCSFVSVAPVSGFEHFNPVPTLVLSLGGLMITHPELRRQSQGICAVDPEAEARHNYTQDCSASSSVPTKLYSVRSLASWRAKAVETRRVIGPLGIAEIGRATAEGIRG